MKALLNLVALIDLHPLYIGQMVYGDGALKGRSTRIRFCDDFVLVFEYSDDVLRVQRVLGKRLERFGLQLHPDKSRLVDFRHHRPVGWHTPLPTTFLRFTHLWGKSRQGKWVLRQRMAKDRLARVLKGLKVDLTRFCGLFTVHNWRVLYVEV